MPVMPPNTPGAAGGVAIGIATIGRNAQNIVEDTTKIAEQAGEDTARRATNMARNAAHIAAKATNIVTAAGDPAQLTAAKIVGDALLTGAVAEGAEGAAVTIAKNAAIIAEEATKITGGAFGGALHIAQGAASIATEAGQIAQGAVEGVVKDAVGGTVEVDNYITTIAGHVRTIAGGVVTDTLRAEGFKLSEGAAKLFMLCAEPNVVLETARAVFHTAHPKVVRNSLFVAASPPDGNPSEQKEGRNKHNELDLDDPMNRHAAISQLQRLVKSLVVILKDNQGEEQRGLVSFDMITKLDTDNDKDIKPVDNNTMKKILEEKEPWFFINGIAGILWDLIECAGQRDPKGGEGGLKTKSSELAQDNLRKQLEEVLRSRGGQRKDYVVIVAHSQGYLLLRLVLDELRRDNTMLESMKRLLVFTFGNPSRNWDVHEYVGRTEHFANKADFVAELGVLNGEGYQCKGCLNEKEEEDHPRQLTFINFGKDELRVDNRRSTD
ncbi:hypothetical protein H2201_004263 [Coniosporium apollinis]|uniref:DUF676 domain-containing protein n=1 Tax=Coniosporium apollinis TaxID=61459 RepID=A0ABQ9NZL5_9PEZI|nr:hypothetical protein H2201_004263 [Coniosporium apollinis]